MRTFNTVVNGMIAVIPDEYKGRDDLAWALLDMDTRCQKSLRYVPPEIVHEYEQPYWVEASRLLSRLFPRDSEDMKLCEKVICVFINKDSCL